MKYLTLFILALFLFQVSYTQGVEVEVPPPDEDSTSGVDIAAEIEAEANETGEVEVEVETGEEENVAEWTDLNTEDFQNDENNLPIINFGVQFLVSQMLGDQVISNSSAWSLSNITAVQAQRVNGVNYRIWGTYTNEEGDDFSGSFTINYLAIGPSYEVLEATYEIEEGDNEITINEDGSESAVGTALMAGLYTPVPLWSQADLEEENNWDGAYNFIDTSEASSGGSLESAVNDGVDVAIAQGNADGSLPEGKDWSLQSVDYIQQQILEGSKYIFWVTLTDGDIERANAAIFYVEDADGNDYVLSTGFWKIGAVAA